MTDTSTPAEEPAAPVNIQEKLDAIKNEIAAKAAAEIQAVAAETDRLARIDAAKAVCIKVCGPVWEALAASVDPVERKLLSDLEKEVHGPHRAMLEAAHLEAAGPQPDVPPTPSGITNIEAKVAVAAGAEADADPVAAS